MEKNISFLPGIYLHIPFCERKCAYCDFFSVTRLSQKKRFVATLLKEISLFAQNRDFTQPFDTIYFGGGTPSLLTAEELEKILEHLFNNFPFTQAPEITLEANPGTMDAARLKTLRRLGVNRLSIGVQSFSDSELRFLERIHSAKQARRAVAFARSAGFNNLSLDLISALPNQSLKQWQNNLSAALDFEPEHLSVYNLIFEQGTPFYKRMLKGEIKPKTETEERRFMESTLDFLEKKGYLPYEVSNFARAPQWISRHNYKYWNHAEYLGFGPAAHSFWQRKRRANARSLYAYFSMLEKNKIPLAYEEVLDDSTLEFEHIFLSLRTYEGLNTKQFHKKFGHDFFSAYQAQIAKLLAGNLAERHKDFFRLSQEGMFLCDTILAQFQ